VLKPKEFGERADKGKELHADADLGETMGALRECFEPHRRAPAFRVSSIEIKPATDYRNEPSQ